MANIKVAVRIRPISEREINVTGADIVVHTDGNELSLTNLKVSSSKAGDSRKRTRRYGFDYCFNSSSLDSEVHATQEKVYEKLGRSALDALFSGFNACLVAYGQSASGKTYTMMGPKGDRGLTPRLCEGLFLRIFEAEKNGGCYETAVSYLEIYNERVRDLLKPSTANSGGLRVREHPKLGPYVQGLTRHTVSTLGSLMSYVEEGTRVRKTASTSQNPTSSRSHALLTVSLTSRSENSSSAGTSGLEKKQHGARGVRLHLVDLAGSERAGNSNYGLHRLKEGANINKSLVALGNVISALAERGATGSSPGRRFIPYRDSALTWLLKDALGGNATTIMLATISPASGSYNETAHTLRFAQRAQSVVNRPVVNEDPVARVIRELRAEISRLTLLLSEKGPSGEEGSSCCCKRRTEVEELPICGQENQEEAITSGNDEEPKSNKLPEGDDKTSLSVSTLHRRFSSDESLSSNRLLEENESRSPRRYGSSKSLDSFSEETVYCTKAYDRARVSSVCYDGVNALALVDIPTLVAVLIKPDDNQTGSAQIEEISGENILEDSVETEISGSREALEFEGPEPGQSDSQEHREVTKLLNDQPTKLETEESAAASSPKEERRVIDENSVLENSPVKDEIIDLTEGKTSSSLKSSKRFGSSESVDAIKRIDQGNRLIQRSYTTLQPDKSRHLNGANPVTGRAKRNWSPRGSTWDSSRRVDFGEKDSAKKSTSDVERPQEVKQQKTRNPLRKQESDSPKRKISRDSNHVGSKEEPTLGTTPKLVRKGSVTGEITSRTQTPIQRSNRRAEIVAAVTERLYSTKKAPEEGTASPGGDQFRSPESTEVKLANTTRMKLQEISRKMLAKRRKTCADTQTEVASTVRVKDTASITDSTDVETQDAAVMTEVHEDCREVGDPLALSITRVKEIATLTERFAKTVRCRDVGIITEDYEDDEYQAESSPERKQPNFAEAGTTTRRLSQSRCTASQTISGEELTDSKKSERRCRGCHNVQECCYQVPIPSADRNVICITLPDMLSITIESPNSLESKIAVTEGAATLVSDEKVTPKVRDGESQTENQEKSTTTDDPSLKVDHVMVNDMSTTVTTRSAACQSDGKTFRIENIFKDPKCSGKSISRPATSDLLPDLTEHVVPKTSLKLTNSVGTSFTPETMEQSTEIEGFNFSDQKATGQPKDSAYRELPNLRFSGLTFKRLCKGNDSFKRGFIPEEFSSPPLSAPIPIHQTNDGSKFQTQQFPEAETVEGTNTASIPWCTVTKIEAEELKSPLLVARLISNSNLEMDSSFSDDSLDPDELSSDPVSKSILLRLDDALCPPDVVAHTKKDVYESRVEEDFADEEVEFPRSNVSSQSTTSRVHDYESLVLGRNCFIPIRQDSGEIGRVETPESEESRSQSKKRVSFSNFKLPDRSQVNETRKPKPIIKNKPNKFAPRGSLLENHQLHDESEDSRSNHSPKATKLNSSTPLDCSPNSNGFRDDISSISGSSETIRSGTLYNSDEDSDAQLIRRKREESDMKRVRFTTLLFSGERGDSGTSDSDVCENAVSDEEAYCCGRNECEAPHSVFASYLNEAAAFVHNINTINDHVNASRMYLEKDKYPEDDYIEYQGCRISLRDDTDEYLKSEDFHLPVGSYKNCLTGIAKLENCIERAVRHDKLLLDKYGIRLESATTSYSLVDPGKDSSPPQSAGIHFEDPRRRVSGFQNPGDFISSVEDLAGITDEEIVDEERRPRGKEDPSDLENAIFEHLMDSANTRRSMSAKPYFRRSTRMSDLSGKGPASYSRFRKKYWDLGSYPDRETLEDSKWYTAASGHDSLQYSPEVMKDTELKVPQCFLMVPDSGKPSSGTEYRSDGGTSSSDGVGTSSESIDTVASVRNKFRYPGSPRAKLLQLVSERRQIVHRSRNGSPS